ncbi:MAG: GIY-YIG nuclease family protein [Chloroflexi bacterium]|nr:GIY-YIG nuclease family protein [Chloroflexota bacterium]
MRNPKSYYVYIMANTRFTTLYVGITNDLTRRVFEHQQRTDPRSFTARYNLTQLVHFEECGDVNAAITREKQLKSWSRARKEALINSTNPAHENLAADWYT